MEGYHPNFVSLFSTQSLILGEIQLIKRVKLDGPSFVKPNLEKKTQQEIKSG